jgi:ABC-2 type transport system permease protein
LALILGGLPLPGSIAFGLSWTAAGMVFAAVAAIAAQVASSRRSAIGLSVGVVAFAYALRAFGDLPESGPTLLTWLSPIGWSQQVRAFAGDRWWVLLLPLTFTLALVAIAFALRSHRDLGAGILQDRPGRANGRLGGVWSLAVRLNRGVFFAWAVAFVGFGLLLGSLASNATGMLDSEAMREIVTRRGGEQRLVDAFIAAELGILGVIVAAFGIAATSHIRSEESVGHAELLLSRATSRWSWVSSHFGLAIGGVAMLMFLGGLAIGVGAVLDVGSASMIGRVLLAAMATIPAAWAVAAIALALAGTAPRFTSAAWGIFIVAVVLGEFGSLWEAPQWLVNLSPFVHTPKMPVDGNDILPVLILTGVAVAFTCLGYAGLRRRDIG